MRILVTGGAGFIGSHLVECLQEREIEIVVLDNLRTGSLENLRGIQHRFLRGSVNDREVVREAVKGVSVVIHLAARVSVQESVRFPAKCEETNILGLLNLLETSLEAGVGKFVLASSAAVYGNRGSVPQHEELLPRPESPYAISKLSGEHFLGFFSRQHGLPCTSLRFFNVYGKRQDPHGPYAAAIPNFITQAIHDKPLTVFGDGEQTRDFIHVRDVVEAVSHVAFNPINGVYNVGTGTSTSVNELAGMIRRLAGSDRPITRLPGRTGEARHSRADCRRLHSLGWRPQVSLEEGLAGLMKAAPACSHH